jgi:DNA mismatch repair ATPase MutS
MKPRLLHPDRDFVAPAIPPADEGALVQDLELTLLFEGMAQGDEFLSGVARQVLLAATTGDVDTIRYRQAVLRDCLAQPAAVKQLYALALEALAGERKIHFGLLSKTPDTVLHRALEVLNVLLETLVKLQQFAAAQAPHFASTGFRTLLAAIERELGADYLAGVRSQLRELEFADGVLVSATLGEGNKGANYTLRKLPAKRPGLAERLLGPKAPVYTITIAEQDRRGAQALWELRERGINLAANALGQAADHMLGFFDLLRTELAFYIGCLNLHERLAQKGEPICFPTPLTPGERRHAARGLYDVGLSLLLQARAVGNDLDGDDKELFLITGANQGGKSTFLRSIGQAQLMMQAGMFVGAESFAANVCAGLFTHYRREEDASMTSGKLDEELARMSAIAARIRPDALLLCNESFAATNEREGSELARQIVTALVHRRIKVFFVTHLNEFAHGLYAQGLANTHFLRAGRADDGGRTYKLCAAAPLQTSFGEDLYKQVFG